ncbi:MAG: hypothetical protein C4321_06730, partial [Chloroflexota bacterium]
MIGQGGRAWAINFVGQVAGGAATRLTEPRSSWSTVTYDAWRAFLWTPASATSAAQMTDLGVIGTRGYDPASNSGLRSEAFALNDSGHAVGYAEASGRDEYGYTILGYTVLFRDGQIVPLPLSGASGINNSDCVVGRADEFIPDSFGGGYQPRPAAWDSVNGLTLLGSNYGEALGINKNGEIAGYMCDGRVNALGEDLITPFFRDSLGTMHWLPLVDGQNSGWPWALNNNDQVVGVSSFYFNNSENNFRAFIWDSADGTRDLNDLIPANSGWVLEQARGINDNGEIVGTGTLNGEPRAFLLRPLSGTTATGE